MDGASQRWPPTLLSYKLTSFCSVTGSCLRWGTRKHFSMENVEVFSEVDLLLRGERWRTERLGGCCYKEILTLCLFP
jgi:hypothetical protein